MFCQTKLKQSEKDDATQMVRNGLHESLDGHTCSNASNAML